MSRKPRLVGLILGLCLITGLSKALDTTGLRFEYLTTENGLPQNLVDCMLQDSRGFIWFGTWNGLCKYDGYTFDVFDSHGQEQHGLHNNFIYAMAEDPFGNLWFATAQGLYVYQYAQRSFSKIITPRGLLGPNTPIQSLHATAGGDLLVGSERGLLWLEVEDELAAFSVKLAKPFGAMGWEGSVIHSLRLQGQQLWVGTDAGLYQLDTAGAVQGRYRFSPADPTSLSNNVVRKVFTDHFGALWVGTDVGLNRYDPAIDGFVRYYEQPTEANSLIHNSVMDIAEDVEGNLIVGTLGGLSILPPDRTRFFSYQNEADVPSSLNNDFINCLLVDRQGNTWIGTERGGVNISAQRKSRFEHFEKDMASSSGLSHNVVNSVYEDDRYLWVGTAGGGLNQYVKSRNEFIQYRSVPSDPGSLSSDFVTSIFQTASGDLLVGTWGVGINVLHRQGQDRHQVRPLNGANSNLVSDFVSTIVEDAQGQIWVGTLGGLSQYDPDEGTFTTFESSEGGSEIQGVGCLVADPRRGLWVGTQTGLYLIGHAGTVTEFHSDPAEENALGGDYVISLVVDAAGQVWAGTYGQGLTRIRLTAQDTTFSTYSVQDGLSNNIVYGIQEDGKGYLWLSTDYGLSRFDPATETSRNFYRSDGLLNNQYYWSASYQNAEGTLYFGGMNGLDYFRPEWIGEDLDQPRVVITDFRLLDGPVIPGEAYHGEVALSRHISRAESVVLSHQEKIVTIEFSSFNLLESDLIHYQYRLEGFDGQWNDVPVGQHQASYTNLKPGDYTFQVRGAGPNLRFGSEATSLRITIVPPIWQMLWFQLVLAGLGVLAIYGYIGYRTLSLKRQKASLERQVEERTIEINQQKEALSRQAVQLQKNYAELEHKEELMEGQNKRLEHQNQEIASQRDELIALNKKVKQVNQLKLSFFTNVSHEFRTPLTLILGPLERLLAQKLPDTLQGNLEVINRNAQRLLHLINQIVDFRRIEKGKHELKVREGDFHTFCSQVYEAFRPLATLKNIDFQYVEGEVPERVWYDTHNLENVLYNLLSNAFKYTPEGGKVRLELSSMRYADSQLPHPPEAAERLVVGVKVIDNGPGIHQKDLPFIFKRFYRIDSEESYNLVGSGIGLALTEELMKVHRGGIFVDSVAREGSEFEIQFPGAKACYHDKEITEGHMDLIHLNDQVRTLKNELLIKAFATSTDPESVTLDPEKHTILVVEDNPDLRQFLCNNLESTYNVLSAEDGEQGQQLAHRFNPDLVVSDIMMPVMDGFALCQGLKENFETSHIPVILLTAKSAVENQIQGLQLGADDYVPKPFNFELLLARIENLIESRKHLRAQFASQENIQPAALTENRKDQEFLERALALVEEQMADPDFGTQSLVMALGVSRSVVHKKLTALTNQSTSEFINYLRLRKAKELLKPCELNISEVAYSVGYNDPKYFSRLFSKQFGESPKQFQEDFRMKLS